jgi:hypothetical protein
MGIANAQLINVNPDPNGEPWLAGGFKMPTDAEMKIINQIPKFVLSEEYKSRSLPSSVDNSLNQYFRPIFNQVGGSCAQASGVGYNYTYEIDFKRGVPANTAQNQYPSHFTYNYLNGGSMSNGSNCTDGWTIIKYAGCPNVADYGGMSPLNNINWITGYDKYYNGMHNTALDYFIIAADEPDRLQVLKNYFYDHGEGAAVGGLVNFYAGATGYSMMNLPAGTPHGGMKVITRWGTDVNHAMTFVGYDDSIRYDYNNDGKYTNNIDINGDNIVNMKDWEIGGLIVANSWGTSWGNAGKSYMMYKLLAEPTNNGGVLSGVMGIKVKLTYEPILTYKITIKHNLRKQIRIIAGSSSNINDVVPNFMHGFAIFNFQGGNFTMQGGSTLADQTIEIGLDATPVLSYLTSNQPAKFFLVVDEADPSGTGQGQIISFSAISYTNGVEETVCPQTNVTLINNGRTIISLVKTVKFDPVTITTTQLPEAILNEPYSQQLSATGGFEPYKWTFKVQYAEEAIQANYPMITSQQLTPSNPDDGIVKVVLGFPFPLYGHTYDSVFVTTDGSILFENVYRKIYTNEGLTANKVIAAYGSDLKIYPEQGDGMWYEGDNSHATFRWKTSGSNAPAVNTEFAVTIYPTGEIRFFYGNGITPDLKWTAGISNGDGINYKIANISNAPLIPDGTKFKFIPNDFPIGMQLDANGIFHGTPTVNNRTWNIQFFVTDINNISSSRIIPFTVGHTGINVNKTSDGLNVYCSPNPFTTHIFFSVSSKAAVNKPLTIDIFDVNGKLVSNVCENILFTESKDIKWNATGKLMNPGVYIVKFKVDKVETYRKIIKY